MKLLITNTFSGKKELFIPMDAHQITLYVCGITPYDYAHIGHGRCYVTFDVLYRLLSKKYTVMYCRNFTDIDDKLINKAKKEYNDETKYRVIADTFIAAYEKDMRALNCLKPNIEPRVTQHIPEIISFVKQLIDSGHAYERQGDVYFSLKTYAEYGKLSKRNLGDMLAGARVSVNEDKQDPLDFALWKKSDDAVGWESPWGFGRPGWHIECSALARKYLGSTIDIHAGGMDLIFPHHENEIAQTESVQAVPFVRYWMHNAFVRIDQEKMSKSLGNFLTLHDIFEKYSPMALRYMLLSHHYRSPLDFSFDDLDVAHTTYQRICKLFYDTVTTKNSGSTSVADAMMTYLLDDLNIPGMLGVFFEHSKEVQEDDSQKIAVKDIFTNILGLSLIPEVKKEIIITPEIQKLLDARELARRTKDWQQSDALRDELKALGYIVQDKKLT
ncbi:MAG: cysteine--tRNA ligase [Candidatus Babeliaceae bacterium]